MPSGHQVIAPRRSQAAAPTVVEGEGGADEKERGGGAWVQRGRQREGEESMCSGVEGAPSSGRSM